MIRSFRNKGLQRYAVRGDTSKLSVTHLRRLDAMLKQLDVARGPEELDTPGWRFHPLKGDKAGRYSLTVSGNWRLTFGWEGEDAVEVDLEDYH